MNTRQFIERSVPLTDFEVGKGDGRTVTAYCATFGDVYPVADYMGRYEEEINRAAFSAELGRGFGHVGVLVNHGMTHFGTPSSGANIMPPGTPLDVRPDGKGLLTVTRYAKTAFGEETLELIRSEAFKFQSFRGPIYKTVERRSATGGRLLVRMALGLTEYGPCMTPVNDQAMILAVRSSALAEQIAELSDEEIALLTVEQREDLARRLTLPTDTAPDTAAGSPEPPPASGTADATATPDDDPSIEHAELDNLIRRLREV